MSKSNTIDWTRYDSDPAYKASISHKIKRNSSASTALCVMAMAHFVLKNGGGFHCYLAPWDCFTDALKIAKEVGASHLYVSCIGGSDWSHTMPRAS